MKQSIENLNVACWVDSCQTNLSEVEKDSKPSHPDPECIKLEMIEW